MTRARTASDARSLERSLTCLSQTGLTFFIGDGGSDPAFVRRLSRLPRARLCRKSADAAPGLVNQLRRAFAAAEQTAAQFFLYSEPDKRTFFERDLGKLLAFVERPEPERPDLVIAARTPDAMASFPEGQRVAEGLMNQICNEAFGLTGDYTYGPLLISRRLLQYFPLIPSDAGWGWRFYLMAVAHQLGMRLELCRVRGRCPRAQKGEDDAHSRRYRLEQLKQNMTGLGNGWIGLLDHPLAPAATAYGRR